MFKKFILLVLTVFVAFSFSECSLELYERMLIKGIGIDFAEDVYTVTVRVANVPDEGEKLISSKGLTVYDALNNLSLQSGNKQMYTQSNFVIFGKGAVEIGIGDSVDFFLRYFKSNPTIKLYMAEDTAIKILEMKKDGKLIPSENIANLMKSEKYCGKVVKSDIMNFVSMSRDFGDSSIMPVIAASEEGLNISGTALFKNLKLTGTLTDNETAGYLTAIGKQEGVASVVNSDKYGIVTGEAVGTKSEITFSEDLSQVNVKARVNCLLASVTVGKIIEDQDIAEIEKLLSDKMKESVTSAVNTSYKNGCDTLNLAYKLYMEETDYWKANEKNWDSILGSLKFNIEVDVHLNKVGEENRPQY